MEKFDLTMERARARITVSKKHVMTDTTDGISQDNIDSLQSTIDDAAVKDVAQKKATEELGSLTAAENDARQRGHDLIRKIQSGAKSACGEDNRAKMKEFHIGDTSLKTTKGMISELGYMAEVVSTNKGELLKSGLKESDIASLGTIQVELTDINSRQENAKKSLKRATKEREECIKSLTKSMRKILNQAKTVFAGQKNILIEFEPVAEGRGGGKQTPPAPQK